MPLEKSLMICKLAITMVSLFQVTKETLKTPVWRVLATSSTHLQALGPFSLFPPRNQSQVAAQAMSSVWLVTPSELDSTTWTENWNIEQSLDFYLFAGCIMSGSARI